MATREPFHKSSHFVESDAVLFGGEARHPIYRDGHNVHSKTLGSGFPQRCVGISMPD